MERGCVLDGLVEIGLMKQLFSLCCVFCVAWLCSGAGIGAEEAQGPILLVDDSKHPHVVLRWTRADGSETLLEADLPYTSPDERTPLGENLEVFVALGGARLTKGVGRAGGAIVRVGFFKTDRDALMLEDIANGSSFVIELTGVVFNQAVTPDNETIVQRLEYKPSDIIACGLTINQAEMFNVVSEDDDMGGRILSEQVRHSCMGGGAEDGDESGDAAEGEAGVRVEEDGSLSLRVVVPYRLLRHKGDPWAMEVPGTFFEPFHFDFEYEVLPRDVAEAEGISVPR